MWAIASWRSGALWRGGRWLTPVWVAFAAVNVGLMYALPGRETIPFHFIWVSMAIVHGLRTWAMRQTLVTLAAVAAVTAAALLHHARIGVIGFEESAEVPLMAAVFLAMVWHVRRRQAALQAMAEVASAERTRREAQQLFVRVGSHELRTPITVARGFTELLRSAHPDPRTEEDTGVVLDELDKLERITRRMVTLMQVDQPQVVESVDVDALLARTAQRWLPAATRRWIVHSDVGRMAADAERLETALDSLVENAVKFTADGDRITLRGRRDGPHVLLEVADEGVGIAAEDLPRVFARDYSRPGLRGEPGSGLGLAIVRAVAEARGGTVEVASAPGVGTTFRLRLPANPGRVQWAGAFAGPLAGQRSGRRPAVLSAD